jgi:hypothetical protein
MDHQTHDETFVSERLAALSPAWNPDLVRARERFDAAVTARRTSRVPVAVGAAALLCVLVALAPQVRTYAQDVWARWTLGRVEVMNTAIPGPFGVNGSFSGGGAFRTQAEVEQAAGFSLHLPPANVTGHPRQFLLVESAVFEETIDVARLEAALRNVGATDLAVPPEWNGGVLRTHVRNAVVAEYDRALTVTQAALPSLDVPIGIALSDLASAVFRASGMSADAARAAGLAYAIRPSVLLRVSTDESEMVRHLALRNGEAWLVGESSPDGHSREVMVLRASDSRIYVVTGTNDEQAIAIAEALP